MTHLPTSTRRVLLLGGVAGTVLAGSLGLASSSALADTQAHVDNGTLQITGDRANDMIVLSADPTSLLVDVNGDAKPDFTFARSGFRAVAVDAGAGDDQVRVDATVPADIPITLDGGPGDDTLTGGNGNETLIGGPGNDTVDGNRGSDTAQLGPGADDFIWDPGDGSDTVDGQGGTDVLDFNGADVAEKLALQPNGQRVKLTRDVGTITMDLGGIDAVNLRTLGGADTTTVGDLRGTDLRTAHVDLNATGGGGDGQADSVVATGTPGPDQVAVSSDAGDAVVSGLATTVRVTGGEPATDRLDVAGVGGDDTLSAGAGLTAPLSVHLLGGDGNDTATYEGSAAADTIGVAAAADPAEVATSTPGSAVVDSATENLVVRGHGGDDTIAGQNGIATRTALTLAGGAGNDTVLGGDGDDRLFGGPGDDTIDGNRGSDTAVMGAGDDRFVWDPGDGSDTVEGGGGDDTLAFNGSDAPERFDVSANGGRVRLVRNIGAITMDLGGVEGLALRALGGADQVTLNDLSGTDLNTAAIDLAATAGGGDGAADTVIQNGTPRRDRVKVTAKNGAVRVKGLVPETTITGAEAANDHLQINTLAGHDRVTIGAGVGGLLTPAVDLGADH